VSNFLGHTPKKNKNFQKYFDTSLRKFWAGLILSSPRYADRVAALSLYYRAAFPQVMQRMNTGYKLDDSNHKVDES